jgi:hypothetical protein
MQSSEDSFFTPYEVPHHIAHDWHEAFTDAGLQVSPIIAAEILDMLNARASDETEYVLGEITADEHEILLGLAQEETALVLTAYWSENESFNERVKQVLASKILI